MAAIQDTEAPLERMIDAARLCAFRFLDDASLVPVAYEQPEDEKGATEEPGDEEALVPLDNQSSNE